MLPYIYDRLGLPARLYKSVLECLVNHDVKSKYKFCIGKKFVTLFEADIHGTVKSGHPTETTLFNTTRNDETYTYISDKAGIPRWRYSKFTGGDDFYGLYLKRDLPAL